MMYLIVHDDSELFYYLTPVTHMSAPPPPPYESMLTPARYIEFALADLDQETERGYINAFGNVKRALHLTVDQMLHQYGLLANHRNLSFPQRLELLAAVDIVSLGILRNLNVERNVVEHEYGIPSRTRVHEAIDVAKLLLLASDRLGEQIPYECVVGWRDPRCHAVMRLSPVGGQIMLYRLVNGAGHYRQVAGVKAFAGRLRKMSGEINPEYKIASEPFRIIELRKNTMDTWVPLLKTIIDMQRGQGSGGTVISDDGLSVSIGVTFDYPIDVEQWNAWLDGETKKQQ